MSVLDMPIINNDDPEKYHPTQKPVDLFAWLIRSYSEPGHVVLDFTAGAGTTAIAALRERRQYICIEAEAKYVEIIEQRIAAERNAAPLLAAAQC
jgi:DNA modification methylase